MMTMSASAQVYKIDNVDIYSFGTLESLKEFVAKQKLTGYESKIPPPPTKTSKCSSSSSQPQTRYNTRRSKLKRLPASSESSFSPSSSSSYEDKITEGCVKSSSSPLSSSEERESGIGSSSSTHSSSWLDDDCSTLDDYLIKLDECLPVSSPRTLNDESHLDMNLDESTTTTTPPPPPTSSSKRNGDSTSDDDEIMVWEPNANSPTCGKAHCRLGCICPPDEFSSQQQTSQQQQQQTSSSPVSNKSTASSSSSATSMQSQHCGRYECMFECLCSRRLRSSTRSNRSTVANDIVLPPASEANATSSATTTYSIGTRRREASVSSTNSIFSNSSLPYASNSRSSQLCKSPKSFRDDYYYYDRTTTNLGVSSSPSKYLNNSKSQRQNNSNQTSNSNMTASKQTGKTTPTQQQQQQQKATVTKIQPKPVAATKTNTTAEFKPYTHRMLLQAKPMLIAGKQSILNDIPLIIEVFTAKWKREPPIAKKCLKLLWKLLNVLAYQSVNWREIEFDYERELTVRLAAVSEKNVAARSSPIRVRIMKFTPTKPANENSSKFREIPKGLSGLQNGRYIVRECDNIPLKISFKENRPQQQLDLVKKEKSETNELVASPHFKENFFFPKSTIAENSVTALCQSFSPVKSTSAEAASLNWSSPKGRYLPRVLCRSRPSHNQSSSSNNSPSNRTSEIFKSLDTLFEKNNIYARHNQPQETPKKEKPLTAIMDANYQEACQLVDSEEIVKSVNDLLNDLVSTVAAATSLPSPQSKKDIIVLNKNSENSNTNNQSNALVRKVVQLVKPPILKSSFLPIKPKPSQTTQPIYKVSLLPTPIMNKVRTGPVKIAPRPPSWSSGDHSNKKRDFSELNESEREEYLAHRKRKRKQDLSAIPSGRISANPTPSPTPTTTTTTLRLVDVGAASYDDSSSISSSNLSSPNAVAVVAATATSSSSNTNTSIKTQSSPLIISTSSLFKSRGQTSSSARKSSYSDNTSEENSNSNNMTQEDLDEEEEEREEINYEDEEIDELEMDLDDEEGENDTQQFKQGRGRGRPRRDESLSLSFSSAPRNRSSISCSYSSDSDGEEGEGSKSGEYRKTIPPNIHSLRERERRSRLKTLLTKLQLAFLESSEESESPGEWLIKANRMFKVRASKQAILHEAVHQIKVAERNERLLQQEREAELRRNISLKNILQSLTNRA